MISIMSFSIVSVTASDKQTFYGSDFILYYELNENDEITITSCESTDGEISIPSEIDNKKVTEIYPSAFYGNTDVTEIYIPASINEIGRDAFTECSNLKNINVDANNLKYASEDGILFNKAKTELIYCPCAIKKETVIIPEGVTNIEESAFASCASLKRITIPDTVTQIGAIAFKDCSNISEIIIPDSVIKLDSEAFCNCTNLAKITIPTTLTDFGSGVFENTAWAQKQLDETSWLIVNNVLLDGYFTEHIVIPDGVTSIADQAFYYSYGTKKITIPEGVTNIGDHSFGYCPDLIEVVLPESLTTIGEGAFERCWKLESINIPSKLVYVGLNAFNNTSWLTAKRSENNLVVENCILIDAKKYTKSSVELTGVRVVASGAFEDNQNILNLTIPETVKYINDQVFSGCSNLKSVDISYGVEKIGSSVFHGCNNLEEIVIPDSVVELGSGVFYDCNALKNVVLSKKITVIPSRTFVRCGFVSLGVLEGIIGIEEGAFMECFGITSIRIPDSIKYIEDNAFASVWNLINLYVPDSVTHIGENAFYLRPDTSCCYNEDSYFESYLKDNNISVLFHDWDDGVLAITPSCTTDGERQFTCQFCNEQKTTVEKPTGHKIPFEWTVDKQPTCTESGYKSRHCLICSEPFNTTVIPSKGHGWDDGVITSNPTCTKPGIKTFTCGKCKSTYTESINPTEHEIVVDRAVDSTCTETGLTEGQHCLRCDDITVEQEVIPIKPHSYTAKYDCVKHWKGCTCGSITEEENHFFVNVNTCSCGYVRTVEATIVIKNNCGSKTINYGETLELTAIVTDLPENAIVTWFIDGVQKGEGETFNVSFDSGTRTVDVKIVDKNGVAYQDENGNEISDSENITVKSGFFQKLISFFKNLFRISRIVLQSI